MMERVNRPPAMHMPSSPVTKGSLFSLQIWPTCEAPAAMVLSVGEYSASTLPTADSTTDWISLELETVKSV